ncbi:MAG: hypothetical protein DMG23_03130, partial [Acidobacteria bacterium]
GSRRSGGKLQRCALWAEGGLPIHATIAQVIQDFNFGILSHSSRKITGPILVLDGREIQKHK